MLLSARSARACAQGIIAEPLELHTDPSCAAIAERVGAVHELVDLGSGNSDRLRSGLKEGDALASCSLLYNTQVVRSWRSRWRPLQMND